MTDKQIIIDDIDVSRCPKQGETIVGITCGNGERIRLANEIITKHKLCKDNPNCIYKQLKRKEQECKELKEAIDSLLKIQYQLADSCTKYEQTLTEIKEICNNNDELQGDFNLVDCDKYKLGKHNLANKILQKISECEANNDR